MKLLFISTFIFSFISICFTQNTYEYIDYNGDTLFLPIIESPYVCDCDKVDWRNKEQKKICAITYDYDFMTEEEKKFYDKELEICRNPDLCDCAKIDKNNEGLLKACNSKFNYASISTKQLEKNIRIIKNCKENKDKEFTVCDCININDPKLKKKCDDTFFNDSLVNQEQKKENLLVLKKCIEDKKYTLDVSTCDCAKYGDSDPEYKALCDKRIKSLQVNKKKLTNYLIDMKICREKETLVLFRDRNNVRKSDRSLSVCYCERKNLNKEETKTCTEIWNESLMTSIEKKAFTNTLKRCSNSKMNSNFK